MGEIICAGITAAASIVCAFAAAALKRRDQAEDKRDQMEKARDQKIVALVESQKIVMNCVSDSLPETASPAKTPVSVSVTRLLTVSSLVSRSTNFAMMGSPFVVRLCLSLSCRL